MTAWPSPDGHPKNEVEVKHKDCKIYPGADCDFDHNPVVQRSRSWVVEGSWPIENTQEGSECVLIHKMSHSFKTDLAYVDDAAFLMSDQLQAVYSNHLMPCDGPRQNSKTWVQVTHR